MVPDVELDDDDTVSGNDSRSKIDNLLQVAAALDPQKLSTRAGGAFAGQEVDQIRKLRRKLLSREYSRRYRMRIREKIGMIKTGDTPNLKQDNGSLSPEEELSDPQPPKLLPIDVENLKHVFLQRAASSQVQDSWELFVSSVQRLSLSPEGRKAIILLAHVPVGAEQ